MLLLLMLSVTVKEHLGDHTASTSTSHCLNYIQRKHSELAVLGQSVSLLLGEAVVGSLAHGENGTIFALQLDNIGTKMFLSLFGVDFDHSSVFG
jgi:hypothetical protein